jgi:hypothetical protein
MDKENKAGGKFFCEPRKNMGRLFDGGTLQ